MRKLERGWWDTDKIYINEISLEEVADKLDEIVNWINEQNKRGKKGKK